MVEVGPIGVRVSDRGQVHQDHAVAVRGVVASLALRPQKAMLVWAQRELEKMRASGAKAGAVPGDRALRGW